MSNNTICTELKPLHYGFVIKKGSITKHWKIRFAVFDSQRRFSYFQIKNFNPSKTTAEHLMELIEKQFYWKQSVDLEGMEILVKGSFVLEFQSTCLAWHKKRYFFKIPKGEEEDYFVFFVKEAQQALAWKHILTEQLQMEFLTPQEFKLKTVPSSSSSPQGQSKSPKSPKSARFSIFGRKSRTNSLRHEIKEEILTQQEDSIPLELLQKLIIKYSKEDMKSFLSCCRVYNLTSQQFISLDTCFSQFFDGNQLQQFQSLSQQITPFLKPEINEDASLVKSIVEELEYWKTKTYFNANKWKLIQKFKKLYSVNNLNKETTTTIPSNINSFITILSDVELFHAYYFQQQHTEEEQELEAEEQHPLQFYSERKAKVKLLISEASTASLFTNLRKMLSPILSKVPPLSQDFGLFRTSLVVGNFFLDWNDSELIIPKRIANSMSILVADVDTLGEIKDDLQVVYKKLSQLIVDWNINYQYKPLGCNCQTFSDAVMDSLGVDFKPQGVMANYLETIKNKGIAPMVFSVSDALKQECQLEQSSYRFVNHWELDSFVINLNKKCPMFQYSFPDEFSLLKAFDRSFWIRYFNEPNSEKHQPASAHGHILCPFDDPRFTASIQ